MPVKYIGEFIGTFILCLTILMTASAAPVLGAIAIGASLTVAIFLAGAISGGHFNPAVTFLQFMKGKIQRTDVALYVASQLAGALAAFTLYNMYQKSKFG